MAIESSQRILFKSFTIFLKSHTSDQRSKLTPFASSATGSRLAAASDQDSAEGLLMGRMAIRFFLSLGPDPGQVIVRKYLMLAM